MALKDKVTKKHIAAVGVVAFIVIAGAVSLHIAAVATIVKVSDLVSVNEQNTSFLRPKQWVPRGSGVTTFADSNQQGTSTAVVGLQVAAKPLPDSLVQSPSTMRSTALKLITTAQVEGLFETGTGQVCNPDSTIKKEADTASNQTTIGLYTLSASCTAPNNQNELHLHSVVGRDGYVRTLILFAKHESWNRNQQAFQTMMASVHQSSQPSLPPSQTL